VDWLNERLEANESLVAPGRFFGVDDHFRIGFGMEQTHLEEGLSRLSSALDADASDKSKDLTRMLRILADASDCSEGHDS
jgi:hypothetical protein